MASCRLSMIAMLVQDIDVYYHVLLTAPTPIGCRALLLTFEQSLNEFLLDFSKIIRGSSS